MTRSGVLVYLWVQRSARYVGLDRAVAFGTLSRGWALVTGPVTLLLIATHFSQEVQGYYYTFGSLLALTVFLELGLGTVIQQFASHEWAGLELDGQGRITGHPAALSRLAGLARMSIRWYGAAGVLSAVGIGLAGYLFFSRDPSPQIGWAAPWFSLCVFSGMNLFLLPAWSLLDGCNQMSETNLARFAVGAASTGATWLAILLGAGLWTAPAVSAVGVCTAALLLYTRYRNFFSSLASTVSQSISWRREVWPMQWRIGLSWLSGYFIFSLFTPVLFREKGAVAAGQFGMTWAIVNTMLFASLLWVTTKAPTFGILIAREQYTDMDSLFKTSTLQTLAVGTAGAGAILSGVWVLNLTGLPLADRLLDPVTTAILLIGTVVNMVVGAMATYLRAHKREPYLLPSVLSGLAIGSFTLAFGGRYGALGMAMGYSVFTGLFLIPEIVIFLRCRRVWHRSEMAGMSCDNSLENLD